MPSRCRDRPPSGLVDGFGRRPVTRSWLGSDVTRHAALQRRRCTWLTVDAEMANIEEWQQLEADIGPPSLHDDPRRTETLLFDWLASILRKWKHGEEKNPPHVDRYMLITIVWENHYTALVVRRTGCLSMLYNRTTACRRGKHNNTGVPVLFDPNGRDGDGATTLRREYAVPPIPVIRAALDREECDRAVVRSPPFFSTQTAGRPVPRWTYAARGKLECPTGGGRRPDNHRHVLCRVQAACCRSTSSLSTRGLSGFSLKDTGAGGHCGKTRNRMVRAPAGSPRWRSSCRSCKTLSRTITPRTTIMHTQRWWCVPTHRLHPVSASGLRSDTGDSTKGRRHH